MPNHTAANRIERSHGLYRLIGLQRGHEAQAAAFAGSRRVLTTRAGGLEAAIDEAAGQIDARKVEMQAARVDDLASAEEVRDLLDALPDAWNRKIVQLLEAHARRPGAAATASEIARLTAKDSSYVWWEYARFGRKIVSALGAPVPKQVDPTLAEIRAVLTFAELDRASVSDDWTIRLRPQLRVALTGHLAAVLPRSD